MSEPQLLSAFAGHWTGTGTGVTVIVPPPGTVASGEVRGGAPATREFALLEPTRLVDRVDAVVLSGGSAFGLAAGDGAMTLLRELGIGYDTPLGPVPIVVGMSIFDGSVAGAPPDAISGRRAVLAALSGEEFTTGAVGAGAGATTGKWRGRSSPGGLGVAYGSVGASSVAVVAVVNAWGDVLGPAVPAVPHLPAGQSSSAGQSSAGQSSSAAPDVPDAPPSSVAAPFGLTNTTLAVVLTDARLTKNDCYLLAQSGHTGFARAIHPAHSRYDGDAVVALATGETTADLDLLRAVATEVTASAIRAAVSRSSLI